MTTTRTKSALLVLAGLGLAGTLAGCSGSAAADQTTSGSGDSSTSSGSGSTSTSTSDSSSSSTSYKDGTYTEQGQYVSPGGQETISVSLTIKSNVVTAVTVKTVQADATAAQYEAMFEAGIGKQVVGKKLSALNVTRVAGSSLTSQGFDAALTKIKADAAA